MQHIQQVLENRQQQLRRSPLCLMIDDASLAMESRLGFTPVMLFFVMGFKDILDTMKVENSTDPLQQSVNTHCDEDSFHWQWYLKDLERISYGKAFLKHPGTVMFEKIWSAPYSAAREVVYESIHLAKTYNTPFYKLVIIEALEATFDCFNDPVFRLVNSMGRQDELEYFGQVHAHSEASHALHEEEESDYLPDETEIRNAHLIVNRIFDAFEKVFDCWYREGRMAIAALSVQN
ncbi:hypothetical protein [Chitinophaga niabensis]|uniref:Iron-containing redox enzyme n=1 Tax=Chitinophaga niabensis TaxID=536979 RepID=A0A1N6FPA9_9BACT|nr:hypothetical protein [Chitinophaga niabensis]SIN97106.1 hypothetical protein SAMN04488055_2334 [Chitinophaga niabensis]